MYWVGKWVSWALGQRPLMMKWFLVFNTIIRQTTPSPQTPGQLTYVKYVICRQKVPFELIFVAPIYMISSWLSFPCAFDCRLDDV